MSVQLRPRQFRTFDFLLPGFTEADTAVGPLTVRQAMTQFQNPQDILDLYNFSAWSSSYFTTDDAGNLQANIGTNDCTLTDIIKRVQEMGQDLPLIIRFPQILTDRIERLNRNFRTAMQEAEYKGHYQGVFPIKVNQRRVVVETIAECGAQYKTGLEAGSKAELALILVQDIHPQALICCNGFKDDDFVRMALWGRKLGKNVIITLEKYTELERVLRIANELKVQPAIGIRFKLHAQGSGRWFESGGDQAKFGLTASEVLRVVEQLRVAGATDTLQMLHCHVGSQLTDIRKIKSALREASQMYVQLKKMDVPITYLNVGGGLAVDYDGSKTVSTASANYGLQEYANTVVWTVADCCNESQTEHPILVTESGRALTAHHAVLVLPVIDTIRAVEFPPEQHADSERHSLVSDILEIENEISTDTYRQCYNEAVSIKDTMHNLFDLGYLTLNDRATIECVYKRILNKVASVIQDLDYVPEDFESLPHLLSETYVCNFSVFQSLPDHWAIGQLFPIMPLSRLHEMPTREATLVDITCDSDGRISKFIDLKGTRSTLAVHPLKENEPYYLGVFLTGAYQDVLGSAHNLLGRVNEVHVNITDAGFLAELFVPGQKARKVIENMGYETKQLHRWLLETIAESGATMSRSEVKEFVDLYDAELVGYTYLEYNPLD